MEIDRATNLQAYVDAVAGKPVAYGVDDCTMWSARWVERVTGFPVPTRPYRSKSEALALIAAAGGLVNIWTDALDAIGIFERYDMPRLGDVGIIDTHLFGQVGVIVADGGFVLWRATEGVSVLRPRKFVKVWSI